MSGSSISASTAEAEAEDDDAAAAAAAFFPFFIWAIRVKGMMATTLVAEAAAAAAVTLDGAGARAYGVVALRCDLIETTEIWMCSVTRCWPCS